MVWVQLNIASFMDFSLIAHCLLSNKHNCRNGTGKTLGQKEIRDQFGKIIQEVCLKFTFNNINEHQMI